MTHPASLAAKFAICCLPDKREADWLRAQGVLPTALNAWPGPVKVAGIETHPPGVFDLADHGRRAFIQPVLCGPQYTDLIDIIAWFPADPARWWMLNYSGEPLGVDQLDRAEIKREPLVLRRTPLDWLRVNGDGVCVLDWKMSTPALRAIPVLVCTDAEYGREVRTRLTAPPVHIPEIRVMMTEAA
jgi:hypothetical protein